MSIHSEKVVYVKDSPQCGFSKACQSPPDTGHKYCAFHEREFDFAESQELSGRWLIAAAKVFDGELPAPSGKCRERRSASCG